MSSTDWPRCQGGTPNRYSGSARAILQVNALATQTSTTAIRRSVAHMPLSWRNQSADVRIAFSQPMTSAKDSLLSLSAKCLLNHENRHKANLFAKAMFGAACGASGLGDNLIGGPPGLLGLAPFSCGAARPQVRSTPAPGRPGDGRRKE